MRKWPSALCSISLVSMATLVGCSGHFGPGSAPPQTFGVQGKVVLANGSPLPAGRITFHPKETGKPEATGEISNGSFRLSTFGKDDGAVPGQYDVSITGVSYKTGKPVTAAEVPQKYQDPKSSGLSAEVKAEENSIPPLVLR